MTKSQNDQNQSFTGDATENTTPDVPTPNAASELQANDVDGAHGRAPSVSSGSESLYAGNTSAVSMEADRIIKATEDQE